MNVEELTKRINELYHKSKAEGLTEEEKEEQEKLRRAYIDNIKANVKSQLNRISIVEPDGTVTRPKKSGKKQHE